MRKLINDVQDWGADRGILKDYQEHELHGIRMAQWEKSREELIELREAIQKNSFEDAEDAVGDVIVTLIMQCALWPNMDIEDALTSAYNIISKRTGKMVDGQFVKDTE